MANDQRRRAAREWDRELVGKRGRRDASQASALVECITSKVGAVQWPRSTHLATSSFFTSSRLLNPAMMIESQVRVPACQARPMHTPA
jgi:hypothetical protein